MKYPVGTIVYLNGMRGIVISEDDLLKDNPKKMVLAGDICILWDQMWASTYDEFFLDENCKLEE